jgi:alkaline phosphatase D
MKHGHATAALIVTATLLAGLVLPRPTEAAELVSGPMLGFRDMRTTAVWFQADAPAQAQVQYWRRDRPEERKLSAPVALRAEDDFAARVDLAGLEPGTAYSYRVLIDGHASATGDADFATEKLWQWHEDPPAISVLLGSCAYLNDPPFDRAGRPYGGGEQIFDAMARQRADWTLWLGDNVYLREADTTSAAGIAARYRQVRKLPALQALLRTGNHLAIWDDHDYGPNDANASYTLKGASLAAFRRYWANPSYGLPGVPGVFTIAHTGDVDFFMLDDRWYRDADALIAPDKALYGPAQMRWLKNALLNSSATFKVIVGGGQFLSVDHPFEGWHHFPEERQDFIDWLTMQKVDGVLFVSGDRHHTELLKMERPGTYPLLDLTCSPLTAGTHPIGKEAGNPRRVEGTLVSERNFCRFDFSGPLKERQLTIRAFNGDGVEKWRKSYGIGDLSGKP